MRTVLSVLIALAFAAPAQASYLHLEDARAMGQRYMHSQASDLQAAGASVGRCWRTGARVVQCSYALQDVCDVAPDGSLDGCSIELAVDPTGVVVSMAPARGVLVVTQHGSRLRAHLCISAHR